MSGPKANHTIANNLNKNLGQRRTHRPWQRRTYTSTRTRTHRDTRIHTHSRAEPKPKATRSRSRCPYVAGAALETEASSLPYTEPVCVCVPTERHDRTHTQAHTHTRTHAQLWLCVSERERACRVAASGSEKALSQQGRFANRSPPKLLVATQAPQAPLVPTLLPRSFLCPCCQALPGCGLFVLLIRGSVPQPGASKKWGAKLTPRLVGKGGGMGVERRWAGRQPSRVRRNNRMWMQPIWKRDSKSSLAHDYSTATGGAGRGVEGRGSL